MGSAGLAPGLIRRTMEHGLLSLLAAVVILAASVAPQSPCTPSPCGINTVCDVNGAGSAVCRCQALLPALLTHVSPLPVEPMLTVDQLAIERFAPVRQDMKVTRTLAAQPIPALSILAEQTPAVRGVETGPSASVLMATRAIRLFAVT